MSKSRAPRGGTELAGEEPRKDLGLYAFMSRMRLPKSYLGKVVLVGLLGTHVPPATLVLYVVLASPGVSMGHSGVLAALLASILLGFSATLWALRSLLAPLRLTSSALKDYIDSGTLPDLPVGFRDEAGRLMADVRYAVERMDATVRSLEGISGTDHLTGLPNRRRAEERLTEEAARVSRSSGLLTLGVVDVNRFKRINDSYGHQAGDACLRHVSMVMRRNVREGDWIARWAGDEFLLVMHDASAFAQTEAVLQRIVKALRQSPARLPGGAELTLSVTVGAVRYAGGTDPRADLEGLFAKADAAMYEAKREGRAWVLAV